MRKVILSGLMLAALGWPQNAGAEAQSSGLLTIEHLIDIKHPSPAIWSPDGRRVAFVWDRAGVQNIWVVDVAASAAPRPLSSYDSGLVGDLSWSGDGKSLYFGHAGDLWMVPVDGGGSPRALWNTPEVESEFALSPDGARVGFVRGGVLDVPLWQRNEGDLFVRSLTGGRETKITSTSGLVESRPMWSHDGQKLVYTVASSTQHADAPEYSGPKILYTWLERYPGDVAVASASGGPPTSLAPTEGEEEAPRWVDDRRVVFQRVSNDVKTREILIADAQSGDAQVLHREVDPKFWSLTYLNAEPVPSPDGRWIAFVSDRDGWDHIYVVSTSGGPAIQVTKGTFEVRDPAWSPDGTRIACNTNQGDNPGSRHLAVVTLGDDPARAKLEHLTTGRGTDTLPAWAPDGKRLLYQHTDPQNSADLFVIPSQAGSEGSPIRLTDSLPSGVDHSALVEPQLVWYRAADGERVPAYLFVSTSLDRSKKHPAIIWIHGDGINQNYDGWHVQLNYATYYSFHQYLAQRGYVVLAPDFRGSIGYGRDWRQGVYMEVGGKDYQDIPPGVDYLKTLGFVDTERVGVWGLSYGGFFTLQALTDRPELFRCGVNVAGPADYRMYYLDPYQGAWTVGRIGTPEENPRVYEVASPLDRVDRIVRPLLVLHGTSDVNVPYLQSVRLIDRLLELGKDVEFMMYPGEYHYFVRAHVLRDAWRRVEKFFDTHLRP